MGIYIIKSRHAPWIKVGHTKITDRRPTVYSRYLNRGFGSCICPEEIRGKVMFEDIELLKHYTNFNINDELALHKKLQTIYSNVGEWYPLAAVDSIINIIENEMGGILENLKYGYVEKQEIERYINKLKGKPVKEYTEFKFSQRKITEGLNTKTTEEKNIELKSDKDIDFTSFIINLNIKDTK